MKRQVEEERKRDKHIQIDRQIDRLTDRLVDRQIDRQIDRQMIDRQRTDNREIRSS